MQINTVETELLHNRDTINKTDIVIALEQYKIFVDTMEKVVERRQTVGTYFLSINVLFVTSIGIFIKDIDKMLISNLGILALTIAGILVCLTWQGLMRYYGLLNAGKFTVIHAIEKLLPIAPFKAEWEALGKGKDSKLYISFAKIEGKIPRIFIGIYILVFVCLQILLYF